MHKTLILFFGFFLLTSCGSSEHISQEHRTTSITPIAHIDTNNPEDIGGIQFEITTSLEKNENIASIISWSHEENEDFLRSHKEKILENFEEFTHNPTTEYSTKNVAVITSAHYHLLKAPYFSEE